MRERLQRALRPVGCVGLVLCVSALLFTGLFHFFSPRPVAPKVVVLVLCAAVQVAALASARRRVAVWAGACMVLSAVGAAWAGYSGPAVLYQFAEDPLRQVAQGLSANPMYWLVVLFFACGLVVGLAYLIIGALWLAQDAKELAAAPTDEAAAAADGAAMDEMPAVADEEVVLIEEAAEASEEADADEAAGAAGETPEKAEANEGAEMPAAPPLMPEMASEKGVEADEAPRRTRQGLLAWLLGRGKTPPDEGPRSAEGEATAEDKVPGSVAVPAAEMPQGPATGESTADASAGDALAENTADASAGDVLAEDTTGASADDALAEGGVLADAARAVSPPVTAMAPDAAAAERPPGDENTAVEQAGPAQDATSDEAAEERAAVASPPNHPKKPRKTKTKSRKNNKTNNE